MHWSVNHQIKRCNDMNQSISTRSQHLRTASPSNDPSQSYSLGRNHKAAGRCTTNLRWCHSSQRHWVRSQHLTRTFADFYFAVERQMNEAITVIVIALFRCHGNVTIVFQRWSQMQWLNLVCIPVATRCCYCSSFSVVQRQLAERS